jgi:hypothetical protein
MQTGRPAEAERIAGALLQRNPGDAQAAQLYGYALYVQGRGEDAIAPEETGARVALGICLIESGEGEAGYANLRAVGSADPKLFAQILHGRAKAGRGRFWLRPGDAKEFLKGD